MTEATVGLIMGSDSDWPVMRESGELLKEFKIPVEAKVVSAHRTPHDMVEYAETAVDRGLKIIIAAAGGAAHLPGMVASLTRLPVIGVPISLKHFDGLDSLLSIVQMPHCVPVATVAVDAAKNAALLAVRMLATEDSNLADRLTIYQANMRDKVREKTVDWF